MNIFRVLKFKYRIVITTLLIVFSPFFIFTSAACALGWGDKEWVEAGCPSSLFGKWVSDAANKGSEKVLNVKTNKIKVIKDHVLEEEYSFDRRNMVKGERVIQINLLKSILNNKKKSIYLKIRPHLVFSENSLKNHSVTNQTCFIKVFEFDSVNNAKFDRYESWEIYRAGVR